MVIGLVTILKERGRSAELPAVLPDRSRALHGGALDPLRAIGIAPVSTSAFFLARPGGPDELCGYRGSCTAR
jgi:hypothetical protein